MIGRSKTYPYQWKVGVLTPQYKKGDTSLTVNYRPLCMLSHLRKTIEAAIAGRILRTFKVYCRQFGFQKGISSVVLLTDV